MIYTYFVYTAYMAKYQNVISIKIYLFNNFKEFNGRYYHFLDNFL